MWAVQRLKLSVFLITELCGISLSVATVFRLCRKNFRSFFQGAPSSTARAAPEREETAQAYSSGSRRDAFFFEAKVSTHKRTYNWEKMHFRFAFCNLC